MTQLSTTLSTATLEWQKVASVTKGGKPYFYVAFPTLKGHRRKFCVAWDRYARQWAATFEDYETCVVPEEFGQADTAQAAMILAEQEYQGYLMLEPVVGS